MIKFYTIDGAKSQTDHVAMFCVRNTAGSVDSTTALVTVNQPPSILTQPLAQTIASGQSVTLTTLLGPGKQRRRFDEQPHGDGGHPI